jgi:tight adherence protein B
LRTHRERGGNLGDTLDRMAESLREIQRLEKRVESLTAQGRATARWLSALPGVILALIYFLGIAPDAVTMLFTDPVGRLILAAIVVLNIVGFLWIRKIAAVDI